MDPQALALLAIVIPATASVIAAVIGLVGVLLLRQVHTLVNGVSHELNEAKAKVAKAEGREEGRLVGKAEEMKVRTLPSKTKEKE